MILIGLQRFLLMQHLLAQNNLQDLYVEINVEKK